MQRCTGIPHTQWIKLISEDDPLALKFAFYLARKRAGEDVKYSEVEFDLRKMSAISLAEDVDDGDSDINRAMGIPDEVAAVVPTGPVTSEPDLTLS